MTVSALKEQITFSEFLEWLVLLEDENEWRIKQEYYLAQIAAEIRRANVQHPRKVKTKDFLIKFVTTETVEKMANSKKAWLTAAKIQLN